MIKHGKVKARMSDTDPDMVDPDTPPADPEPGPHRETLEAS